MPRSRRRCCASVPAASGPPRRSSSTSSYATGRIEQGFRSCLGILRLGRSHGAERLEAACDRALQINARTLTSVRSILLNRLDGRRPVRPPEAPPIPHANIRGPQFFH